VIVSGSGSVSVTEEATETEETAEENRGNVTLEGNPYGKGSLQGLAEVAI